MINNEGGFDLVTLRIFAGQGVAILSEIYCADSRAALTHISTDCEIGPTNDGPP
jgi:hypothetical protein